MEHYGLSSRITETIQNARNPSTRCLYIFKWQLFVSWCRWHSLDPVHCPTVSVLKLLVEHFFAGVAPATPKVYAAAVAVEHVATN